jgi:predicted GNAT superfamily acetyltransferase
MTAPVQEAADGLTFRPLETAADYQAGVELQRATWGQDFGEAVPGSILKINQKVGGVSAGVFDPDGRMLAFVFGLTGLQGDPPRRVHWSHMLAVHPDARDHHLGTRLKLYQREVLLPLGVEEIQWTYDPLEARNAHLNLNRLGAVVIDYVEDMYDDDLGSELARGIGTDRFIVSWAIQSDRIAGRVADLAAGRKPDPGPDAERYSDAPVANPADPAALALPDAPRVRVEIPVSIQTLKAEDEERAHAWRLSTRRAFEEYMGRGYRVETFWRDPREQRCFYGLAAEPERT